MVVLCLVMYIYNLECIMAVVVYCVTEILRTIIK